MRYTLSSMVWFAVRVILQGGQTPLFQTPFTFADTLAAAIGLLGIASLIQSFLAET